MKSTCKISELWSDLFARYKLENFHFYELFSGKNKDNMLG